MYVVDIREINAVLPTIDIALHVMTDLKHRSAYFRLDPLLVQMPLQEESHLHCFGVLIECTVGLSVMLLLQHNNCVHCINLC